MHTELEIKEHQRFERGLVDMKLKKALLPLMAGVLAIGLAACGGDDKGKKDENSNEPESKALEEMQEKLAAQQVDESKVVAVVNKEEIKGEQYNTALLSIQSQVQEYGQDPSQDDVAEKVKEQTLDVLVNQTLLLQEAKKEKVEATKEEIEEEYQAHAQQFGDEKAMKEMLESQEIDEAVFKEYLAESIIFSKYSEQVAPFEKVSDKEAEAYYNEIAAQAKEAEQELPPLQEVNEEIKTILEQEAQNKKLVAYVETLRKDADVELKL